MRKDGPGKSRRKRRVWWNHCLFVIIDCKLGLRRTEQCRVWHRWTRQMAVFSYYNWCLLMNVAWISLILGVWCASIAFLIERVGEITPRNIVWNQFLHWWWRFSLIWCKYPLAFRGKYVICQILQLHSIIVVSILWPRVVKLKLPLKLCNHWWRRIVDHSYLIFILTIKNQSSFNYIVSNCTNLFLGEEHESIIRNHLRWYLLHKLPISLPSSLH